MHKKSQSLSRRVILKKPNEVQDILKTGAKLTGKNINIFYKTANENRFAVLTPKRIGGAVQRNRMKRLAREIYRRHPEWFEGKKIIFFIKRFHDNYNALENEIHQLVIPT
jgi:ribonuclease P protein component